MCRCGSLTCGGCWVRVWRWVRVGEGEGVGMSEGEGV